MPGIDDDICKEIGKMPGMRQSALVDAMMEKTGAAKNTILSHLDKLTDGDRIERVKKSSSVEYFLPGHSSINESTTESISDRIVAIKKNLDNFEKNSQKYPYGTKEDVDSYLARLSENLIKNIQSYEEGYRQYTHPSFDALSDVDEKVHDLLRKSPDKYKKLKRINARLEKILTLLDKRTREQRDKLHNAKNKKKRAAIEQRMLYLQSKFDSEYSNHRDLCQQCDLGKLDRRFIDEMYQKYVEEKPTVVDDILGLLGSRNPHFTDSLTNLIHDMLYHYNQARFDVNHYDWLRRDTYDDVDEAHHWSSQMDRARARIVEVKADLREICGAVKEETPLAKIDSRYREKYPPP